MQISHRTFQAEETTSTKTETEACMQCSRKTKNWLEECGKEEIWL